MRPPLVVFLLLTSSLQSCELTKKISFNQLSDKDVCQIEQTHYPAAKGVFRAKRKLSKAQESSQYIDIVDFINVYNKDGLLIASTGNGTCEFNTLTDFSKGNLKVDSSRTIKSLLELIEPVCGSELNATNGKTTIVVGSGQFMDQIPMYRSRRKVLNERLNEFSKETTSVFIVNFDLRVDSIGTPN